MRTYPDEYYDFLLTDDEYIARIGRMLVDEAMSGPRTRYPDRNDDDFDDDEDYDFEDDLDPDDDYEYYEDDYDRFN